MGKINLIGNEKIRVDKFIAKNSKITRNDIKLLVQKGKVLLNNQIITKVSTKVNVGDKIQILELINHDIEILAEDIDLNIVYEDDDLVVINKTTNMVVHPAPGNWSGTLVNALMFHYQNKLSTNNGKERPGIVHRLDKDTSGLIVVAKNNEAHNFLAKQLFDHSMHREYLAITVNRINNKVTHIDLPIARSKTFRKKMTVSTENSKKAITHVYEVESTPTNSLVRCILETGRTHQIRVHLNYIKNPVLNDPLYGKSTSSFNQFLHGYKLSFIHPNGQKMTFKAEPPQEFLEQWDKIKNTRLIK